jgi:hypothetical protein
MQVMVKLRDGCFLVLATRKEKRRCRSFPKNEGRKELSEKCKMQDGNRAIGESPLDGGVSFPSRKELPEPVRRKADESRAKP